MVTLGPASLHLASALAEAGATAFRINAAHLSPAALGKAASSIASALPGLPLVVDLQGAKMRLGWFAERAVADRERVVFAIAESGEDGIPLPHPELFQAVRPGDTVSVDDGRLSFRVEDCPRPGLLLVESMANGLLKPRKGVNLVEHPVELCTLGAADRERVLTTGHLPGVCFAFSFMKTGAEADWVRQLCPGRPVIGKIERREAIENIETIAGATDALWICRGDLGAQLGPTAMASWIARFSPCNVITPVLMAGQVLEHLRQNRSPTRSEVCHLFDLVAVRGYAGIVLSDETAIGTEPIEATRTASSLLRAFTRETTGC
ncbi:MAG: pyruvate kinase [Pseudomonadota bacterium]